MSRYHASPETLSAARAQAWKTRRAKYGKQGHSSSYSRLCNACGRMAAVIVRLHNEGILSEGQAAKAIGIDRVELRRRADEMGKV